MVFSIFCFVTYFQGKTEFSTDEIYTTFAPIKKQLPNLNIDNYLFDLVNSICVLYKDGLDYKFSHRSFQGYFTALFLKVLPDSDI